MAQFVLKKKIVFDSFKMSKITSYVKQPLNWPNVVIKNQLKIIKKMFFIFFVAYI